MYIARARKLYVGYQRAGCSVYRVEMRAAVGTLCAVIRAEDNGITDREGACPVIAAGIYEAPARLLFLKRICGIFIGNR